MSQTVLEVRAQAKDMVLGVFEKLLKATISFVVSVCLSARKIKHGPHWTYSHEI